MRLRRSCCHRTGDMTLHPVFRCRNLDTKSLAPLSAGPGCLSLIKSLPLPRKVQSAATFETLSSCTPTAGFWGVPPRDFSILTLFPDTTHIYGWTRCMENKTPANLDLESHFNPDIPTVFFAQSFCAKTALAHHLANLHPRACILTVT